MTSGAVACPLVAPPLGARSASESPIPLRCAGCPCRLGSSCTVMGRRLRVRGRTSPSTRVLAGAAMGAAVLVLAAFALAPAPDRTRAAHHSSRTPRSRATTGRSVSRQAGAVPPRQLARARSATRQFMRGYLRFAYGEAPASSVRAVGHSLRRQLTQRVLPCARRAGSPSAGDLA